MIPALASSGKMKKDSIDMHNQLFFEAETWRQVLSIDQLLNCSSQQYPISLLRSSSSPVVSPGVEHDTGNEAPRGKEIVQEQCYGLLFSIEISSPFHLIVNKITYEAMILLIIHCQFIREIQWKSIASML